jgi:hypothetical protein
MNGSASKRVFWCAIIAQVIGAQVFFWDALPDYRELTAGEVVVGTPEDFAFAVFGLVIMQSAYWYARRLQPQIPFRYRVVLGHVLLCVSEVSFFFVSALATVAMFDHWRRSQFVFWKLMLLAAALFAFFCYKRQLASVGDALLEIQSKDAAKTTIKPQGTGQP